MNNVVVKIEMSGNRYNAFDFDGNKYTSEIGTGTRKKAYTKGMALERRINKSGKPYWWSVPMSVFESTSAPVIDTSGIDVPEEDITPEQVAETKKIQRQVKGVLPIDEPEDSRNEPAVFVANGSNSSGFSWSLNATSMGSIVPVREPLLMGSAPNTIKCLAVSDVITCKPLVGTKLAPLVVDKSTALVVTPLFSTHL